MTNNRQSAKRFSGRIVAVVLLVVVLVFSVIAVLRISRSVEDKPSEETTAGAESPLTPLAPRGGMPAYQLTESDLEALRSRGLSDPMSDLLADLASHTEFIAADSAAGESGPAFLIDRSRVVSPSRLRAVFVSGNDTGSMLLEYAVDSGNISWRVLETSAGGE